jgi:RND family efflux transporter MFP subunit
MNLRSRSLAAHALLIVACSATVACSRQETAPDPVRAVRTITVSPANARSTHEFAGEVKARIESRLGFRVGGKMVSRTAEVGQRVVAGQVLAQLDPSDLKLAQDSALAAVRAAQTNYDLTLAEFRRYRDLRDQGFISAFDLEKREAAVKAQKAALDQTLVQADVQRNQAGYAALVATAPGVITAVDAEVGTVLAVGTPVVRLAHDGPRDAVFAVPEDSASSFRALLGKPGGVRVQSWGATSAMPATVREVAAAADATTRTFQVKADIGPAGLQLGQTVTVLVDQPPLQGITRLPLTAVFQHQGQSAVWLVDGKDGELAVRQQVIAVGGADGNAVVVVGGLAPGQVVVTAGVHVLTPGQKVKLYEAPVAAAASAASR